MSSSKAFYFDDENRFVIYDFNHRRPFSSFLPGIAGKKGVPMWVFYVNRGQCVASFGISNKDNPIMEFFPAFRAYQSVETLGFRTFMKVDDKTLYEPFSSHNAGENTQEMFIGLNELELRERSHSSGIEISVLYYTLPMEKIPALIRNVRVKNISNSSKYLEIIDGMPALLPFGIHDYGIKHVGNTLRAWMDVHGLESNVPIFRLRSTAEDTASVSEYKEGNFYASIHTKSGTQKILTPIVDPNLIFGMRTSMSFPEEFSRKSLNEIMARKQITSNKVPCAFSPVQVQLKESEETEILSVIGHTPDSSTIDEYKKKLFDSSYLVSRYDEGNALVQHITQDIFTRTSSKVFDMYCQQTYLDNVLRGGHPQVFSRGRRVYHIYSRKHGDLERDYNYFVLLAEYYSSGNGNYRDINQNRREDVFFNPDIERYDVKFFANLIQADGYNPLVINGVRYRIPYDKLDFLDELVEDAKQVAELKQFVSQGYFTPGSLTSFVERTPIVPKVEEGEFLKRVIEASEEEVDAVHGEGFWSDHWTYNLDMIESYLNIYPENKRELLFEDRDYTYYDNAMTVLPRCKRYVLVDQENNKVRQLNFLIEDSEKLRLIESRRSDRNSVRMERGKGEIYRTNLIAKLINLAAIKFATLDPLGMGIEMEAGKPGWYDAMNGLPGLFGSSVAEAFELSRLLDFLVETLREFPDEVLTVPEEVMRLIENLVASLKYHKNSSEGRKDHLYWEAVSDIRENYREETKLGFGEKELRVHSSEIVEHLEGFNRKLRAGLDRAVSENNGIMPTYFYYEPKDYEVVYESEDELNKHITIRSFSQKKMPLYLEGVVKGFHVYRDKQFLKELYEKVRNSDLYDKELKMYKVNAPLDSETIEIGRARAFTPGWLENESIWLHMEYKYMLELIKSGLFEGFYEDFGNVLVPFMNPSVYGRSPLENSSFIASSANPDSSIHGTGFVARLSGSTAEFLSIWKTMFAGEKPFVYENGQLFLKLQPVLPGWLFDKEGKITFNFLGKCRVTYHNPSRSATYDSKQIDLSKRKTVVFDNSGKKIEFSGNVVGEPYSRLIRDGKVEKVEVFF